MIEIQGRYNTARCFTDAVEPTAAAQIKSVCDQAVFAENKIRIMPDVHAGMGCTIGTTMTVIDKVVPGMVGVDIGCGMETVRIHERDVNLPKLDALIREKIPCGRDIRKEPHMLEQQIDLTALRCAPFVGIKRARHSIGTLGGGNHFIEMERGSRGDLFLVVHSGSRHLGLEVAKHYQDSAFRTLSGSTRVQLDALIAEYKAQGREKEISAEIQRRKKMRELPNGLPKDLAYVEGQMFEDYIHDMRIVQRFAALNRQAMTEIILEGMGWQETERFTTIHNYIDTDAMILRKGAVSAKKDEKLLIPINMRDGSLLCVGKGNEDWNCSAPHGAGRLMSRKAAFQCLSMEEYQKEMQGIYSTCVVRDTLDESPMAYKNMDEIVKHIAPTAEIVDRLIPIYNFKAAE